jgi:hypothetical protein
MKNTGNRYSQHAHIAPWTRSLTRHLINRQSMRHAASVLGVLMIIGLLAYLVATLYLPY